MGKQRIIRDPQQLSTQPTKVLEHSDVLPDGYDTEQFIHVVEGFVEKAKYVMRKYEDNERIVARSDLETQDLLHEIHLLPAANVVDGYHYYKRLREVQTARRRAKHENTLMKPMYQYLQQKSGIVGDLTHLKNMLRDAEEKVEAYTYKYRIQE